MSVLFQTCHSNSFSNYQKYQLRTRLFAKKMRIPFRRINGGELSYWHECKMQTFVHNSNLFTKHIYKNVVQIRVFCMGFASMFVRNKHSGISLQAYIVVLKTCNVPQTVEVNSLKSEVNSSRQQCSDIQIFSPNWNNSAIYFYLHTTVD